MLHMLMAMGLVPSVKSKREGKKRGRKHEKAL